MTTNRQRTLIRGGTVLTNDPTLGEFARGDVLVEGDRILAVGPDIAVDDAAVIEAADMIVMPGLVDSHRHTWQTILRQGRELDPIPLTSRDVFEFSTIEGAKACGYGHLVGTLTPGKQADIVLVDTNAVNLMPLNYSYGSIIESTHAGNIDTVLVAGKVMKRHGKLVGVDLPGLRRRVDAARDGLFRRAGIPHDRHWMPQPYLRKQVVGRQD